MSITNVILVIKIIIKQLNLIAKNETHYLFLTNVIHNSSILWTRGLSLKEAPKNFKSLDIQCSPWNTKTGQ